LKKHFLILFLLVILLKCSYFLFYKVCFENIEEVKKTEVVQRSFIGIFNKSDAGWYERIATKGYPKITDKKDIGYSSGIECRQSEWAFFPVYPLLLKGVMFAFNIDFNHAAFITSLLFTYLCFISFYFLNLFLFKRTETQAFYNTLFFILFPFNYYYSMYYTEALFFSLIALCFIAIYKNKLWLLSVLLIPLSLTRPNGLAILLPLYLFFLETNRKEGFKINAPLIKRSLFFVTGPLGFALYCLYQKSMTNEYFAFSLAQAGWYREFMFPLLSLFRRGDYATQFNSVYIIIFMLISIFSFKKFPLSLNVLIWVCILLPLCSGSVLSIQRYISIIFPLMVMFGNYFQLFRIRNWLLIGVLIFHFGSFYFWVISSQLSF
jgi:hypothetical protein